MKKSISYLKSKLGMNNPTVDNVEAGECDVLVPWRQYNYQYNFENGDGTPCKSKKFHRRRFEHDKDLDGEDLERDLDDEEERDMEESVSSEVLNMDFEEDDDFDDEWSVLIDPDEDVEIIEAGDEYDDDGNLTEAIVKKTVIRDGQKKIKLVSDREGYKTIRTDNGMVREVKMSKEEIYKRKMQQRTAKLKRDAKMDMIQKKRKKSILKRSWDDTGNGPKYVKKAGK